ncbi:MAG: hypothetical protein RE471_04710 [Ferroplasma sp.]|uniref:hypothetical protein n=1 Tax=Ferroplasma sp. TaxID=2591003 RepID=UPI0028159F29|nr:hypothetical protein [Ferroplasma sp.]WMT52183.1 MAG: hypothetical protein RE471_04710 [Ferroplasma sp.]
MKVQVGNGSIEIGDKEVKLIGTRILSISVTTVQGPCNDEMCPLIKKPVCTIVDHFSQSEDYRIENPLQIEMQQEVYNSINRERQAVKIKYKIGGKFEIKGLSLIGTA